MEQFYNETLIQLETIINEVEIEGNSPISQKEALDDLPAKDLFEFIPQEHSANFDMGLFSLLLEAQGEDYEEEQFANRMKKKKKKGRRL